MYDFDASLASIIEESTTTDTEVTGTETTVEESAPQEETTTTPENTTETTAEQPTTTEPQKIKVRFRHEDRELTLDEAVVLAQKGLLYDDENVSETMTQLKELAKANGFSSTKEYMQQVSKNVRESQAKQLSERENIPENIAQQLIDKDEQIRELTNAQTARNTQEQERQKLLSEVDELQKMYPDVEIRKLPMEVYEAKSKRPDVPLAYHYA